MQDRHTFSRQRISCRNWQGWIKAAPLRCLPVWRPILLDMTSTGRCIRTTNREDCHRRKGSTVDFRSFRRGRPRSERTLEYHRKAHSRLCTIPRNSRTCSSKVRQAHGHRASLHRSKCLYQCIDLSHPNLEWAYRRSCYILLQA